MSAYPGIRIEGGLLGPDVLDKLLSGDLPGQRPADFGLGARRSLTDEIAAVFADARSLWGVFQNRLDRLPEADPGTTVTRDAWVIPFLGLLGYELNYNARAYEVDGLTYAISHRAGDQDDAPPTHIVGARQELGRVAPSGRPRMAPHSLVQQYLNRSEQVWGMVTNGETMRLLRDSTFVRKQAYVEFDLRAILEEQLFQDFVVLYRLIHRSRLPRGVGDADECLLAKYYAYSVEQGGRVREHLRDGVEECLKRLANGYLSHPGNAQLRARVSAGEGEPSRITPEELYRQLLRLVYRLLFLLVSEDRGLISNDSIYRSHYGVVRLRRLVDDRAAYTDHDDIWRSLLVLWKVLSDGRLAAYLHAAPLDGELFAPLALDGYSISNRDLLGAFWHLAWYQESRSSPPRRVNYAALDVEELGSVYESLLEYRPQLDPSTRPPLFDLAAGSERRSTGSYYTPPDLVAELIRVALEPVIEERLQAATTQEEKERAILSIRVCDPAAGSGHFLLAAARRLGRELARIRTGEEEPAPEHVRSAIRDVVSHCIFGVDKNPLAVELCRVALWLEAHADGKPLTFLDHRVRCGDSLVGVADLNALAAGIPDEAFKAMASDDRAAARAAKRRNAAEREAPIDRNLMARALEDAAAPLRALEHLPEDSLEQVREKAEAYRRAEASPDFQRQWAACDVFTAAFYQKYPPEDGHLMSTQAVRGALSGGSALDPRLAAGARVASLVGRYFHWPLAFPEVLSSGGFDAMIGNPPFMGGKKISTELGQGYRKWLEATFPPFINTADICCAFYRRSFGFLRRGGRLGMVATNTIGQGDTRESGLAVIVGLEGIVVYARRFIKWPGVANVEVNLVGILKPGTSEVPGHQEATLDGAPVETISSRLDAEPEVEAMSLPLNDGKAFIGDFVRGMGFILEREQANELRRRAKRNGDCLYPFLIGDDVNGDPGQTPSREVICFHDLELEQAGAYPDLLSILAERVKPEREALQSAGDRLHREYWWRFANYRRRLRRAVASVERVLVRSCVSEMHSLAFVPNRYVYSHATVVFAFDDDYHFALLQSNVHEAWVWRQASSLASRNRYTPTDCFDTFPFPPRENALNDLESLLQEEPFTLAARFGAEYHEHRRQMMLERNLGLTKTYNLFHNPECVDEDVRRLRDLHMEMDRAILGCYDWGDLDPQHGFYQNDRGQTRFTVSPEARREILRRLLELNARLASEQAIAAAAGEAGGAMAKPRRKGRRRRSS